ncbi:MAG TPA: polysaccharide export protein [Clostridiales bacterium]|nr:polysaccharide export protein [Clostridiales bacterium]
MNLYTNEEGEINLIELFYLIRSKLWLIVLFAVLSAAGVYLYSSYMITSIYTSKTQLYIINRSTEAANLSDIQVGTQLTKDYMVLVKSRAVVNKVIENLSLDKSYEDIAKTVSASNPSNTRILEIKVDYPNANMAKRIADEFANVSGEQIAKIMATDIPEIIDEGNLPTSPSSPNISMNTLIGGIIGAVLMSGIIIILHMMDDTIKDSDDVERYLELNTLGLIPIEGKVKVSKSKKKKLKKSMQKK